MANRKYQGRSVSGTNDFIHIDLLPDVKRPRQFNVNILLLVLIAVFASWLIIYLPLTTRQERLDNALEERSDLQYELLLVNEERVGYNIEQERVTFLSYIENANSLKIEFMDYHTQISNVIEAEGLIDAVFYDGLTKTYTYRVDTSNAATFDVIRFSLIDLPFVINVEYQENFQGDNNSLRQAEFEIEVDTNVE